MSTTSTPAPRFSAFRRRAWSTRTRRIAVAAGSDHSCALLTDHSVACWGTDDAGQIGEGAALQVATAQPIRIACP
jgi:alpha-tubulin suppressor-like RCC1 family protein